MSLLLLLPCQKQWHVGHDLYVWLRSDVKEINVCIFVEEVDGDYIQK